MAGQTSQGGQTGVAVGSFGVVVGARGVDGMEGTVCA